jgi:flagellar hook-associated protein 1 FlgK
MSILATLASGRTALRASSAGLSTTSHNVANATNTDFTRQRVEQANSLPVISGGRYVGTGVDVTRIARASDRILGSRRVAQQGHTSKATTEHKALEVVARMFDESGRLGVRGALDQFFDRLTAASTNPADRGLRNAVLSAADQFASTLRNTATGLQDQVDALDEQVVEYNNTINPRLAEIASLNLKIRSAGGDISAGDLADRRDALIKDLAEQVGARADFKPDGSATVFLGSQAVVDGGNHREVIVQITSSDTAQVLVKAGSSGIDITAHIAGEVGGFVSTREKTQQHLEDLGTFAVDFANAANAVHATGKDYNGNLGGNLFTYASLGNAATSFALNSTMSGKPDLLAFSGGGGKGDGVKLASLIALEEQNVISGTTMPGSWLSQIEARVGQEVATARDRSDQYSAMMSDLDSLHAQLHGVDLDEEASNLITYQMAYQAAAKVITVADRLLGTLLETV